MIDVTFRPSEAEHPGTVAGGILCIPRGFTVNVPKKNFGSSYTEAFSLKTNKILSLTFRIMIFLL